MKTKRKNIDLSVETIKIISVEAAKNGTNFKRFVQTILEEWAKKIIKKQINQ